MGIKGSLNTLGLPDVMQILSAGEKTGTLVVTRGSEITSIYFREGNIVYAVRGSQQDALLEILLRQGSIASQEAERIRIKAHTTKRSIETILLKSEDISKEAILSAVITHAKELVYDLFQSLSGEFEFREGELPEGDRRALTVSLETYNLIMEGARRIDEWVRIRKLIPSIDTRFRVRGNPENCKRKFSADELRMIRMLDGTNSIQEICRHLSKSEFEICHFIFSLDSTELELAVVSAVKGPVSIKQVKKNQRIKLWQIVTGIFILVFAGYYFGAKNIIAPDEISEVNSSVTSTMDPGTAESDVGSVDVDPGEVKIPAEKILTSELAETSQITVSNNVEIQAHPNPLPESTSVRISDTPVSKAEPQSHLININTDDLERLTLLPGIGPSKAKKIIDYREKNGKFSTKEELTNVKGIGPKTLEHLREKITL